MPQSQNYSATSGTSPMKYPYKESLDVAAALAEAPIIQLKQFGLRIGLKPYGLEISHVICSVLTAKRVIHMTRRTRKIKTFRNIPLEANFNALSSLERSNLSVRFMTFNSKSPECNTHLNGRIIIYIVFIGIGLNDWESSQLSIEHPS